MVQNITIVYMEQQSLDHPSVVDEACMVLAETWLG